MAQSSNKPLLIILAVFGGIFLVSAGGCAALWLLVLRPAGKEVVQKVEDINKINDDLKREPQKEEVKREPRKELLTEERFRSLKRGASRREIETHLGTATPAEKDDIQRMAGTHPNGVEPFQRRWLAQLQAKRVWVHESAEILLLTCYDAQDKLVGMVGRTSGDVTEYHALPTPPEEMTGDAMNPVATLTAQELEEQAGKFANKWVAVKVQYWRPIMRSKHFETIRTNPERYTSIEPANDNFFGGADPIPLETLDIVGKVLPTTNIRFITLRETRLVKRTLPTVDFEVKALDFTTEFDKNADEAMKKYSGKVLRITGEVNGAGSSGDHLGFRGLQDIRRKVGYFVDCKFDGEQRLGAAGIPLGSTQMVVGLFKGNSARSPKVFELVYCRVVK